jgi:hypothetical protein
VRRYAEDGISARTRSLTGQKRCSLEPVRRLLQLSPLFHRRWPNCELIKFGHLASCRAIAGVSTKLLAGVRGRSASAGRVFAPVWLFSSCQRSLHQEGALSAPCSCDVLLLAIAPSGRENAAGSAFKPFRGHFVVRGHRFIMLPTMMVPCWWRQMHALSALVQSQAEPSWQEDSDISSYS